MFRNLFSPKRVYLDHASTTPISPRVQAKMLESMNHSFGNASALYNEGVEAKKRIEESRKKIAALMQVKSNDIIFTSGGTESDVLALRGCILAFRKKYPAVHPKVLISSIEHAAIIDTAEAMKREGLIELVYIPVHDDGVVDITFIENNVDGRVALISVMYVNNEIGTIQPIRKISLIAEAQRVRTGSTYPLVHTDACQATNYLPIDIPRLKVDLMTLNSSKCYGPKGVGLLYVRHTELLEPIMTGGGQEHGFRSGTEPTMLIEGLVEAIIESQERYRAEAERLLSIQKQLIERLKKVIPNIEINGSTETRIANNVNVYIPGITSEELVIRLDSQGISASSKSACSSIDIDGSYVILAIGKNEIQARQSLRITMGRDTTESDTDYLCRTLEKIVTKYRN